jgi:hypothetical protein
MEEFNMKIIPIGNKGIKAGDKCIVENPISGNPDKLNLKGKEVTIETVYSFVAPAFLAIKLEGICMEDTEGGKWFESELELIN